MSQRGAEKCFNLFHSEEPYLGVLCEVIVLSQSHLPPQSQVVSATFKGIERN